MPPEYRTAECRDAECRATIIWASTKGGKSMPVDTTPTQDGTVLLEPTTGGGLIATVVDPDRPPLTGWPEPLRTSHFATCPAADRWRTKKARS